MQGVGKRAEERLNCIATLYSCLSRGRVRSIHSILESLNETQKESSPTESV